jgi:hypothetical protein
MLELSTGFFFLEIVSSASFFFFSASAGEGEKVRVSQVRGLKELALNASN